MSLPVDARVYDQQQQTAQHYSTTQWAADRRAWWSQPPQNAYLAPSNAEGQAKLLKALEELRDRSSSRSSRGDDSGSDSEDDSDDVRMTPDESSPAGGYVNADDIIVVEELGAQDDDDDSDDSADGVAAAAAGGAKVPGYPCALPLAYLLTLPQQVRVMALSVQAATTTAVMRVSCGSMGRCEFDCFCMCQAHHVVVVREGSKLLCVLKCCK
jgi:hypothetical protein